MRQPEIITAIIRILRILWARYMFMGFTLDPFGTVISVIKKWEPSGCNTESECIRSLRQRLEKDLKRQKIISDYEYGTHKIDIVVDGKVPIKIKLNLRTAAELQRTIEHMNLYLEGWKKVLLVLCGEIKPSSLEYLKGYADSHIYSVGIRTFTPVEIVNKGNY